MELAKIGEKKLVVKEFNGERVITAWDIADIHEKDTKRITEQFNRNKRHFICGEDYFEIGREDFLNMYDDKFTKHLYEGLFPESLKATQKLIPNNVKEVRLYTESGYMMLAKTFDDEKSWQVQRELVKGYFIATKKMNVDRTEKPKATNYDKVKEEMKLIKETADILGFTKQQELEAVKKIYENNGIDSNILPQQSTNKRLTLMSVTEIARKFQLPYGSRTLYEKMQRKGIITKNLFKWEIKEPYFGFVQDKHLKLYEERFNELLEKIEKR